MARVDEDPRSRDAGAENPDAGLPALLNVSPQMVYVSEPASALSQQKGHEEVVSSQDNASPTALAAPSQSGRMPDVNNSSPLPLEWVRNGGPASIHPAHPAVTTAPPVEKQAEHVTAEPVTLREYQASESDRMSGVSKTAKPLVDRLQNGATVTGFPALFSVSAEKNQVGQAVAEPVQTPEMLSSPNAAVPAQPADTSMQELDATAESEIEILISQSRPITVRATAASVLVQELSDTREPVNPEQVIEKVRTADERNAAKEMASSAEMPVSDSEAMPGSGTSPGSGSNQGQHDVASDNQMFEQQMHGQLKTDHQGGAALSAKAVSAEPLRQDIPEQVAQQVKERLVQHDVKPGNQQITLTLSPDTLGELKMNLNLQGQKLSVEIVAENRAVRDAILQHTEALKESLARQNITMESFDVTTGGKGSGNQGQNQNAWRELARQQQQQQFWTSPRGYQTAQAAPPSDSAAYQRQQGQTMLDIHY
jgi:flagellar hook-length control protein FliK